MEVDDGTLLALVDVLDALLAGYQDCTERIYAAEYVSMGQPLYGEYLRTLRKERQGELRTGVESEKLKQSIDGLRQQVLTLRKKARGA